MRSRFRMVRSRSRHRCARPLAMRDRKSTRLNSSHLGTSYAVFCLKKKTLEDAAGTLTLASEMYAEDRERFSELLSQQATAMVVLAAQFEQAAELARTEHG